jgi:DNA processing protein
MAEPLVPVGSKKPSMLELLALHLSAGVGAVTYRKLLRAFGSVQGILAAPASRLEDVEGVGEKRAATLASGQGLDLAAKELERASALGVKLLGYTDEGYPAALRQIYDPPLVLYVRGELHPEDAVAIAVVGARNCSYYGRGQAERFAGALAAMGFTVVSGLARGIDTAAHLGALEAGGRTVAVMGRGLAGVYPPENEALAERIAGHGAVVSELPVDTPPSRENFPRRNRLISAMALGVLIVEGSRRSGSLITAHCALEQGREVFAVPGKIDNPLASGPNGLIKTAGAKLVEEPADILEELGPVADELVGIRPRGAAAPGEAGHEPEGEGGAEETEAEAIPRSGDARETGLTGRERALLGKLSSDPVSMDEVIERSGLPPAEVSSALMVLEIRRLAKRLPGQRYVRAAGH